MEKIQQYVALVEKRKNDTFFPDEKLLNPSEIENGKFDSEEIGPWSRWHNDLDAKILVIGQDWGDKCFFIENQGRDTDNNPTNKYLTELFKEIGYELGKPTQPETPFKKGLFFSNAILGIKTMEGGMSTPVRQKWIKHTTNHYTRPLIDIIKPEVIITLGAKAYYAMRLIFPKLESGKMNDLVEKHFVVGERKILLFPRYHCGGLGLANRSFDRQKSDWQRVNAQLSTLSK